MSECGSKVEQRVLFLSKVETCPPLVASRRLGPLQRNHPPKNRNFVLLVTAFHLILSASFLAWEKVIWGS
jgi:hypothetical protein